MKKTLLFLFIIITGLFAYSQESLKIVWLEKYEWKIISNEETEDLHLIEIIPGKENAENWTMIGQMMSVKGSVDIPLETVKDILFEETKTTSPDATLTFLEKDETDQYPWILFKIECPSFIDDETPESQLWYIRQGANDLYITFIALKKKKLKKSFIKEWSEVFKSSEIVHL